MKVKKITAIVLATVATVASAAQVSSNASYIGYSNQAYHTHFGNGIALITEPPVVYHKDLFSPSITYSPNNGFVTVNRDAYTPTLYMPKLDTDGHISDPNKFGNITYTNPCDFSDDVHNTAVTAVNNPTDNGFINCCESPSPAAVSAINNLTGNHASESYDPHIYSYDNDKVIITTWANCTSDKYNNAISIVNPNAQGSKFEAYGAGGGSRPALAIMSDGSIFESHGGGSKDDKGKVYSRLLKVDGDKIKVVREYASHGYGYNPSLVAYSDPTGKESIIEVRSAYNSSEKLSDIRMVHIDPKTGNTVENNPVVIDSAGKYPTIALVKEHKNDQQSYILEVNEQQYNNVIRLIDPNDFTILNSSTFAKGSSPSIAVNYDEQGKPYAIIVQESNHGAMSIKVE